MDQEHDSSNAKPSAGKSRRSIIGKIPAFCVGLVVGGIATFLIVASLVGFGTFFSGLGERSSVDIYELEEKIESASDLTITKVAYAGFEVADNATDVSTPLGSFTVPFTENTTLVAYKGVIGLGFDVEEVNAQVNDAAKTITITLPEIGILYNEFDNAAAKSYVIRQSIFNPTTFDESNEFINQIKEAEANSILSNEETLSEARLNAENVIREILTNWTAAEDYKVVFA